MTFCFSLFFSLNTQVLDAMNEALTHEGYQQQQIAITQCFMGSTQSC